MFQNSELGKLTDKKLMPQGILLFLDKRCNKEKQLSPNDSVFPLHRQYNLDFFIKIPQPSIPEYCRMARNKPVPVPHLYQGICLLGCFIDLSRGEVLELEPSGR